VQAVTRWGKLGGWDFLACYEPQGLPQAVAARAAAKALAA
jgi:hypothetical protein